MMFSHIQLLSHSGWNWWGFSLLVVCWLFVIGIGLALSLLDPPPDWGKTDEQREGERTDRSL